MNAMTVANIELPDTLEDLTQFVLVGKAKLSAYMLKLKTVNKLSVAQEIRDQTLQEAQEISTALIAAEQRIGELLLAIPKATGNQYINANSTQVEKPKTKAETVKEMGYSKDEAADYQTMAKHPEVVQRVIDEAIAKGEVVTKTQVLREIKTVKDEAAQREKINQAKLNQKDTKIRELLDKVSTLEELAEPQVVEKIPDDYEALKTSVRQVERDYLALQEKAREKDREITDLKAQLGKDKLLRDADRDVQAFTTFTMDYIRRYGGHVWAFEQLENLSEPVRKEFIKAIKTLDSFAQQLIINMEGDTPK
jgi:hypothetical protein